MILELLNLKSGFDKERRWKTRKKFSLFNSRSAGCSNRWKRNLKSRPRAEFAFDADFRGVFLKNLFDNE